MPLGVPTLLSAMLLPLWGAHAWVSYYASLYKDFKPADMAAYLSALKGNLRMPGRLDALRGHLFASKEACALRLPTLAERKLPVLCLWGGKDPDFPGKEGIAREITEMKRRLPQAETHVLEGVGHYPQAEQPAAVAQKVLEFAGRVFV